LARRCFQADDAIFDDADCDSIYRVPLVLEKQGILKKIFKVFKIRGKSAELKEWKKILRKKTKTIKIALVGKYVNHGGGKHADVYVSVMEALKHGAIANGVELQVDSIDANDLDVKELKKYKGIVVPQGWGSRGAEGIIQAVTVARENKIPYLGLCYGMQMAVIEFSRNVLGLKGANSEEVDSKARHPVVHIMPDQKKYLEKHQYGGTIRLGSWPCVIRKDTKLEEAYSKKLFKKKEKIKNEPVSLAMMVYERHRHRYEVNNDYRERLEKAGMKISGTSPDGKLVEAIELLNHPFFVATQFHPEYKSRPLDPHPIFADFVEQVIKKT
jgi:CTP synthase